MLGFATARSMAYFVAMDWQRLADVIRAELARRGWTQRDLADRANVDLKTISLLVNGHPRSRLPRRIPRIEEALGWAPGSARAVLEGGDPTPMVEFATDDQLSQVKAGKRDEDKTADKKSDDDRVTRVRAAMDDVQHAIFRLSSTLHMFMMATWDLPDDEKAHVLHHIRAYQNRLTGVYGLLEDIKENLEQQLIGSSVKYVDGLPLTAVEVSLYIHMREAHGEDAAADAVRAHRKAFQHGGIRRSRLLQAFAGEDSQTPPPSLPYKDLDKMVGLAEPKH